MNINSDKKPKIVNLGPIGTKADGDLKGAFIINGNSFIIQENAIYEIEKRKAPQNENLPDYIHRLIINQGANQPIVGQTLFQTLELTKSNFLDNKINKSALFSNCVEILQEAKILEYEVESYCTLESRLIEADIEKKGNSMPSIRDVETRCKTVFQKAHHIQLILNKIILLFFPGLINTQSEYETFLNKLSETDAVENELFQKLQNWSHSMNIIRVLRNKLNHQNIDSVSVKDFYLNPDKARKPNELYTMRPSLELNTKNLRMGRIDLSKLFPNTVFSIISTFQDTIAFLVSLHLPDELNLEVREIPEKNRRNKWVKYGYWTTKGKRFI